MGPGAPLGKEEEDGFICYQLATPLHKATQGRWHAVVFTVCIDLTRDKVGGSMLDRALPKESGVLENRHSAAAVLLIVRGSACYCAILKSDHCTAS